MARIFLSHAKEDLALAVSVRDWLRDQRHQVFLDRDLHEGISVGEAWKQRLYRELRAADAVVCVVTATYTKSPWCAAEIGIADALGSRLLPLQAEPGVTWRLLDSLQYADFAGDRDRALSELASTLRGIDAAGGSGWADDRSPFPGLRPFDVGMARAFCGRGEETRRLTSRLRSLGERADGGLLLVVGPSGCGKSSLVRAGLMARLNDEPGWAAARPLLPGRDPVGALARALTATANQAGLGWTIAATRQTLQEDDGLVKLADELLVAGPGPARERLLLVIDQSEELLTRAEQLSRHRFVALLRHAVTAAGPVRAVLTLRSEFQDQLLALPELAGTNIETVPLRPLARDKLRVVIAKPARLAGYSVDRELVDQLVADTGGGEALPLLAFTLNHLANDLRRGDILSASRYEDLGGVQGALTRHGDAALTAAVADSGLTREQVLAGLVHLATLDPEGRHTSRRVRLSSLSEPLRTALNAFVDRRLLITANDDRGSWVGVAHEELLTAWPPLNDKISECVVALQAVRSVDQAAAEWRAGGRADRLLWDADRLAVTLTTLGLAPDAARPDSAADASAAAPPSPSLDPDGYAFLQACRNRVEAAQRRARRRRTSIFTALSVLLLFASTAAVTALFQQHAAEQQRRSAVSHGLVRKALLLRDSQPRIALALSIEAFNIDPKLPEARDGLLSAQARYYGATLLANKGAVHAVAYNPDGSLLATAQHDRAVCLWKMPDRRQPRCLSTADPTYSVAFSPDGRILAGAGQDGVVSLWETQTWTKFRELAREPGAVKGLAFSPKGEILATAGQDGIVGLWETHTFSKVKDLVGDPGPAGPVNAIAFSPDSPTTVIAIADAQGVTLRSLDNYTEITTVPADTGPVRAIAFSPDGKRLATGSDNGSVGIWDTTSHPPIVTGTGHTDAVRAVAFSPDGRILATGSADDSVQLWDAGQLWDTGSERYSLRHLASLTGPTAQVQGIAFSPDGHTLASAGADSAVGLWHVSGPPDDRLRGVRNAAVSGPGGTLVTADRNHTPLLWRTAPDTFLPTFQGKLAGAQPPGSGPGAPFSMAISPDGQLLAAPVTDSSAALWNLRTKKLMASVPGSPGRRVRAVAFSPDGALAIASSGSDNDIRLWDTNTFRVVGQLPPSYFGSINAMALGPNPRSSVAMTAATGGADGTVAVSRRSDPAQDLDRMRTLPGDSFGFPVEALAFSPDGAMLASGSDDGSVKLWNLSSKRPAPTGADLPIDLPKSGGSTPPILSIAFSPDGRMVAAASNDGVIKLWDVDAGTLVATLAGPAGTTSVTFPPDGDGRTLITSDQNGTPVVWAHDPAQVEKRLCGGPQPIMLTPAEWLVHVPTEPYQQVCR